MTFNAKAYLLRPDLESVIAAECGTDEKRNREAGHVITGTAHELRFLGLSDTSTIFGVRCVIEEPHEQTKVRRKRGDG